MACGVNGGPFATRTMLGWTVNGPLGAGSTETVACSQPELTVNRVSVVNLDELWQQQFKNDFPESTMDEMPALSRDYQWFLEKVTNTVKHVDGQYQISLPLKQMNIKMPNNRKMVVQRLFQLKKRLQKDPTFFAEYNTFINELLAKGYAEMVPEEELNRGSGKVWYIPHHGVYHPTKKKLRVVFDCGASC